MDDQAVVTRIAQAIYESFPRIILVEDADGQCAPCDIPWQHVGRKSRAPFLHQAKAVLAAVREPALAMAIWRAPRERTAGAPRPASEVAEFVAAS